MIRTPLINDVFDARWRVRNVTESRALQGHFDSTFSIVPWVASKAAALLWQDLTNRPIIRAKCTGLALPGMQTTVYDGGVMGMSDHPIVELQLDPRTSDDRVKFLSRGVKNIDELSQDPVNALFLPQSGDFRLADEGKILGDGTVVGYYQVPEDFLWHDNAGHMDPIILEEVAAQIVTLGFAKSQGKRARESFDWELNQKYPILTFASSSLHYHKVIMPNIESRPVLVLVGKVGDLEDKRAAEVNYTLSVQYPEWGPIEPIVSGHISATKTVIRSLKMAVAQAMKTLSPEVSVAA